MNPSPSSGKAATEAAPSKYLDDDAPNVTPEEQAEYDQVMENALTLMYTPEGVRPEIVQALSVEQEEGEAGQQVNSAILALAQSAVTIVARLDDSAREAGKPISDEVLYHAGFDVVQELAEIAEASKIHDYSEEDITGAFAQALDMYREKAIADGRTNEETLKAQFNEINQAESEGRLDELLPGLGGQAMMGEQPAEEESDGA